MKIRSVNLLAAFALLLYLLMPVSASAASANDGETELRPVQAFDVVAGKVVKTVPNSPAMQGFAKSWLKSVTGMSPKLQAEDKCGYVFRIPLDEPTSVTVGSQQITTQDVFLFYCPKKPQLLLIFDENRKPYLLKFKATIKPFIKAMDL